MKQPEKKSYSVKQIFERSLICSAAYFVFCGLFIVLVFRNNEDNSQNPVPLLFFICMLIALMSCVFEMFLRDEQNNKFLPVARYWVFWGKIFLFIVFEVVMILFRNFLPIIFAVTILPVVFLISIYLIFRKHLRCVDQKRLIIKYKIDVKETKRKYIGFSVMYFLLAGACITRLVLEIVLGNKINGSIDIGRLVLSAALIVVIVCAAIANLVHAIKFNWRDNNESD